MRPGRVAELVPAVAVRDLPSSGLTTTYQALTERQDDPVPSTSAAWLAQIVVDVKPPGVLDAEDGWPDVALSAARRARST